MHYSSQYKVLNFYLPMNQLFVFLMNLLFMVFDVKAQTSGQGILPSEQDKGHNIQPSLAVVIGVLSIMFILTFILLMYAKFYHRTSSVQNHQRIQADLSQSRSRFSGIDKSVIESLPFFRFSSLRGSREGLECAVCLAKFEDIEILRLLPKCKHAFHIDCIDQWLEKHSSCPLCRYRVGPDDLSFFSYSNSLRFLQNQSEMEDDPEIELFVQREEDDNGSSRFSIGSSFRRLDKNKGKKEEELPIQESCDSDQEDKRDLHKYNHMIIVSNVILKNRWSNVSSSDLMLLNAEMLNAISSNRFSSQDTNPSQLTKVIEDAQEMNIRKEMKRKREFDSKFSRMKQKSDSFPVSTNLPTALESNSDSGRRSNTSYPVEKRSMSEITFHPRFSEFNMRYNTRETPLPENNVEERIRRVWLPIARRTVEWFANREKKNSQPHKSKQSLNV